jgi:hypothetical protein
MDHILSWEAYIEGVEALCRRAEGPDFDAEAHAKHSAGFRRPSI